MMGWPRITCDLNILLENVNKLADILHAEGRHFAAVTKCVCADAPVIDMLNKSRCDSLADARLQNLASMKTDKPRFLIRVAQPWEIPNVVRDSEMSYQSEIGTIRALGAEAQRQGKRHGVILALDMGDLREGCFFKNEADVMATAQAVLDEPWLELLGVGTNLGCFGGVTTTETNMNALVSLAEKIEARFGIRLRYISGMSTGAQSLLLSGGMPPRVNHARMGEAWLVGWDSVGCKNVPGMRDDAFIFSAQLVEIKDKDSKPTGIIGGDAFGHIIERPDLGPMRRGIVACGVQDVDRDTLLPVDHRLVILGGSSDHTLLNLNRASDYKVGDIVSFKMYYAAVLRAYTSAYVEKEYVALR